MRRVLFCIAAMTVAPLSVGEPPPKNIVKPIAVCDEARKVCEMKLEDFRQLQAWHAEKFAAMQMANGLLEDAAQEIELLRNMLARYAGGCTGRKT